MMPSRPRLRFVAEAWAEEELEILNRKALVRQMEAVSSPQGAVIQMAGQTLVNFSSNDYLGLARDPRLVQALAQGGALWGVGSGAARLVVGDFDPHRSLEARLSSFELAEAVLLFNSGYAANVGIVCALVGKGDVVFSDALNHASLVDGCRLSRATVVVYPHLDMTALEAALSSHGGRRKLVVTDAVFSMDGDRALVKQLVELCRRNGAALMVDEAHATGVVGPDGAGLCAEEGVSEQVDVRMGTLGKALGVFGAYAATAVSVRQLLIQRARPFVYSTSLPPAVCAAAERAVEIVQSEPHRRETLWRNIRHFARGLRSLGFPAEERSAIFPVVVGSAENALRLSDVLRRRGLLVKAIRPPTVPEGTSRLRFAMSAAHTLEHLENALEALGEARADGTF